MTDPIVRWAALSALGLLLIAFADTPWRTFRQRFVAHRWAERMVLFSIEMNLILLWLLAKVIVNRDAPIAPAGLEIAVAWAGAVLAWAGALFAAWAKLTLGYAFSASFAIKQDHPLVTSGPYAIVRHPIYTGLMLLGVGLGVAFDSWLTVGFAILFVLPLALQAAVEEQMLNAHFGDAWRDYRARVPRFVPGWRASPRATPSPRR